MQILISNEQDVDVDEDHITQIAMHVLDQEDAPKNSELSIALVDEEEIRRLNAKYRGKDAVTDVLAFESDEPVPTEHEVPYLLGDVIICPAVAKRQAEEYGQTFKQEMALLLVHGTLHLLGYDHETDEEASEMETREHELLKGAPGLGARE